MYTTCDIYRKQGTHTHSHSDDSYGMMFSYSKSQEAYKASCAFRATAMDTQQSPPKPRRVSPEDEKDPQGAWQEEESLEVYRRKRTHKPPTDAAPEIVRFVKRHPKRTEEVYETIAPRRDGRKEIILLEPVQFRDQSPDSLHDDYSLYRMEEYVDASS
ncbi:hypothetical protein GCK32_013888, partial [Trichostrongylus colubriformis]